jgi:hypothetical protein
VPPRHYASEKKGASFLRVLFIASMRQFLAIQNDLAKNEACIQTQFAIFLKTTEKKLANYLGL